MGDQSIIVFSLKIAVVTILLEKGVKNHHYNEA